MVYGAPEGGAVVASAEGVVLAVSALLGLGAGSALGVAATRSGSGGGVVPEASGTVGGSVGGSGAGGGCALHASEEAASASSRRNMRRGVRMDRQR